MLASGAAFLQALTDFRQECVYQALHRPHEDVRLYEFTKRLRKAKDVHNAPAVDTTVGAAKTAPTAPSGNTAGSATIGRKGGAADNQPSDKQPHEGLPPLPSKGEAG